VTCFRIRRAAHTRLAVNLNVNYTSLFTPFRIVTGWIGRFFEIEKYIEIAF